MRGCTEMRLDACRFVWYFSALGYMQTCIESELSGILLIAAVCTLIESFPATIIDDNWSVPAAAAAMSHMLASTGWLTGQML